MLPSSWAELMERLAVAVGGRTEEDRAAAVEWARQAVEAGWGARSLRDLDRPGRQLAFQKLTGALLALEDEPGDLAFVPGARAVVAGCFARYLGGALLEGPPWRIDPAEADRPPYAEWSALADFGGDP